RFSRDWSSDVCSSDLEDTNVLFLLIGQGMEKVRLMEKAKEMDVKNVRFLDPVPKKDVFKYILASEMGASVLKKVDTFKTVYSNRSEERRVGNDGKNRY